MEVATESSGASSRPAWSVGLLRIQKSKRRVRSSAEASWRAVTLFLCGDMGTWGSRTSVWSQSPLQSHPLSCALHWSPANRHSLPQRAKLSHLCILAHLCTVSRTLSPGTMPLACPAAAHPPNHNINTSHCRETPPVVTLEASALLTCSRAVSCMSP